MSEKAGRNGDVERYLRTRFLERIAHDLRGPVGVTSGALDELEIALDGRYTEAERALFLMARRGLKKLLRVADRLGRAAQLEARGLVLAQSNVDLAQLVRASVDEAQVLEGRRGIALELSGVETSCVVKADADWLGLVLTELIGNAIRHAKRQVTVRLGGDDDHCAVAIEDDGSGIPCAPGRRFAPSDEPRGLGLALTFAHDVAAAHGGKLSLESPRLSSDTERKGTLVMLHLPKAPRR